MLHPMNHSATAVVTSARPYNRITPPTTRRWVLIRSVAKFLGPDLRLAVARADPETASAMRARLHDGKTWVSHLLQTAAAHLLTDPEATSLVAAAREAYQQRLRTLTAELSAYSITPLGTPDGLNIWIDLPAAVDPHAPAPMSLQLGGRCNWAISTPSRACHSARGFESPAHRWNASTRHDSHSPSRVR